MADFFRVSNLEKFQHYKDRNPPWIKLYGEILEKYEFGALPDASKAHLIAIWLLASRTQNRIAWDPIWIAGKINARSPVDLDVLLAGGFIEMISNATEPVADCKQDASKVLGQRREREESERKTETEREKKPEPVKKIDVAKERAPRALKSNPTADPANRKAVWEQKVQAYMLAHWPQDRALAAIQANLEGSELGKLEYEIASGEMNAVKTDGTLPRETYMDKDRLLSESLEGMARLRA